MLHQTSILTCCVCPLPLSLSRTNNWISFGECGSLLVDVNCHGCPWISLDVPGSFWISLDHSDVPGSLWIYLVHS